MTKPQVTVFIDYQNLHMSAHEKWCNYGDPPESCLLHPLRVAQELVDNRAPGGELQAVRVYRGRPNPRKEPRLGSATDKQALQWQLDDRRVKVFRRPLWYPPDFGEEDCIERPREKGIDVALAVDVVAMAMNKAYEVGILVTRDTDLLPAIEAVMDLKTAHVEVATWEGSSRLRTKPPRKPLWCHQLTEEQWRRMIDRRPY